MWVFTVLAQDYSLAFLFLSGVFFVTSARKTGREEYLYDTEKSAWKQDGLMNENDDKEWIHQHRKTHTYTISTLETQIWKTHKRAHSANVHRISSKPVTEKGKAFAALVADAVEGCEPMLTLSFSTQCRFNVLTNTTRVTERWYSSRLMHAGSRWRKRCWGFLTFP